MVSGQRGGGVLQIGTRAAAEQTFPPNHQLIHLQLGVILERLLGKGLPFPLDLHLQSYHLLRLRLLLLQISQ